MNIDEMKDRKLRNGELGQFLVRKGWTILEIYQSFSAVATTCEMEFMHDKKIVDAVNLRAFLATIKHGIDIAEELATKWEKHKETPEYKQALESLQKNSPDN